MAENDLLACGGGAKCGGDVLMLELNGFYNMDCIKGMKHFPDNYFDLAIVDPPYGINVTHKGEIGGRVLATTTKFEPKPWDLSPPSAEYFDELFRVSKNQVIWGANHFISRIPFDSSCWLIWDKDNGHTDFADCELAWTSFKTATRIFKFTWSGFRQGNMRNKEVRIHPTQKPIPLYEWILRNYANDGDKILDTHVGSASSLIACHNFGLEFVGFEIDEEYYKTAASRLKSAQAQMRLF